MKKILKFILVVIVLFGITKVFGKHDDQKQGEEATTVTTTAETTSTTTPNPEQETPKNDSKEEKVSEARTKYQQIVLGDPVNDGEGGTAFEDVKALLGEPDSVSTNSYGDTQSMFVTWHDSSLKGIASFTVSFTNNLATGKGYSGFSLVNQIVNQNRYSMVPIRISFLGIMQMEALVLTSILPLKMDTQLAKVSTE